jgi:serine/threonine-protein kinase HipA
MGRKSHTAILDVFMNGKLVGHWSQSPQGESFQYAPSWLDDTHFRPISLSLPALPGNPPLTDKVESYFDNLLPDSKTIRQRLGGRYGKNPDNAFDLLAETGRDCVGALQILAHGEAPQNLFSIEAKPLTEAEIARHLRRITTSGNRLLDEEDDLRLSIAGAQEKTALLWHEDQWQMPHGATPTTHIFKLPLGLIGNLKNFDMTDSVENEWLCAKLCEGLGLPVAPCEIGQFEDQKVLIVERFDRRLEEDGSWIIRLPQEDMCQALGYPSHLKYQDKGGPGIEAIMNLLRASEEAETDRLNFFMAQVFFWLIAGIDGHAKNFSIALLPQGQFSMTPLYDVLSAHTIIKPSGLSYAKAKLAMSVRGKTTHYNLREISYRHWVTMAAKLGLGAIIGDAIAYLLDQVDEVIENVAAQLPESFPSGTASAIFAGIRQQKERMVSQRGNPE